MSEVANIYRITQPREYQKKFLEAGVRSDGRKLDEFREALIGIGPVSTADGSALVALGETKVICGIKLEVAPPKVDKPRCGYIVPNVDLPPLASSDFRPGPPSELAQVSSQLMLEIVLKSKCVLLEDLCIAEGRMCWVLYCDLICLNYDGNLLDACTMALTAALCNVKLPKALVNEETGAIEIDFKQKTPLNIRSRPVATTSSVFEKETLYVDPVREEEKHASLSVTVVTLNDISAAAIDSDNICVIHKTGGGSVNEDQVQQCISNGRRHTPFVLSLIESALTKSEA